MLITEQTSGFTARLYSVYNVNTAVAFAARDSGLVLITNNGYAWTNRSEK